VKGIIHPVFATDNPNLEDYLPRYPSDAQSGNIEQNSVVGAITDPSSSHSQIRFSDADSYSITAQATYLLSRVFEYIRRPPEIEAHVLESRYLDETILAMAVSILRRAEDKARFSLDLYCMAYGICLV
jgi:hypothetical protein